MSSKYRCRISGVGKEKSPIMSLFIEDTYSDCFTYFISLHSQKHGESGPKIKRFSRLVQKGNRTGNEGSWAVTEGSAGHQNEDGLRENGKDEDVQIGSCKTATGTY